MNLFKAQTTPAVARSPAGTTVIAAVLGLLIVLHLCKVGTFIAAGQAPLQGDAAVYWGLGQRVHDGDWLLVADPPEVARSPGYPYFLAFFQATCGRHALAAATITQHFLLLVNVALMTWICWRLNRRRSSIVLCLALSLACFSCHGVAACLLSDSLLSFLLTLCVVSALAWRQSPSKGWAMAIGLSLGAAILTKPVAQFAGLIIGGWMLAGPRSEVPWRKRIVHCGLAVAAALALATPWLLRGEAYFGRPFLTRVAGRSLWWSCFKGNPDDWLDPPIPFADGPATRTIFEAVPDVNPHDTWRLSKSLVALGSSEIAVDDLMLRGAKEAIVARPWKYIASRCRRYVWFWLTPNETYRPNTGDFKFSANRPKWGYGTIAGHDDNRVEGQSTWRSAWYFQRGALNFLWHPHPLWYALAAFSAVASICILARAPEHRGMALFLGFWLLYFSAVTTLAGCPSYRYRMILEPPMIILVVASCGRLLMTTGRTSLAD